MRLTRVARSTAHCLRIRETLTGCSGMSDVVSCVREFRSRMCPTHHLRWLVPEAPRPFRPAGRFVVRVNECQRMPAGARRRRRVSLRNIRATSRETRRIDVCSPHLAFSKTSTHASRCCRHPFEGKPPGIPASRPKKSRSVDSLRRAALARRRRCLTPVDRSGRTSDAPSPLQPDARKPLYRIRPSSDLPPPP